MLISFILSYSENSFVVCYLSLYFVLGQDPGVRAALPPTLLLVDQDGFQTLLQAFVDVPTLL